MEFSTNIDDHDNDVMCILPWIHMHPWPNGKTMLCCDSPWETNIGDLRENSLQEVWNSERMKQVRFNMLQGKKCKECVRCYEKSLTFPRIYLSSNDKRKKKSTKKRRMIDEQEELPE